MSHLIGFLSVFFALTGGSEYEPQAGDLFFQDLDCGGFCDAIEAVTEGVDGADFSHVGIVAEIDGHLIIAEAGGNGVVLTNIDSFLNRSHDKLGNPKVIVGRMKNVEWMQDLNWEQALEPYLGKPYDETFDLNNDAYYCSELIVRLCFDHSFERYFEINTMTFKEPDTREFYKIWSDYFAELGEPISEGEPGYNPGMMSRSEFVEIVHIYGHPTGFHP